MYILLRHLLVLLYLHLPILFFGCVDRKLPHISKNTIRITHITSLVTKMSEITTRITHITTQITQIITRGLRRYAGLSSPTYVPRRACPSRGGPVLSCGGPVRGWQRERQMGGGVLCRPVLANTRQLPAVDSRDGFCGAWYAPIDFGAGNSPVIGGTK